MTYWNSRHSAHSYSGQRMIIDRLVIKLCFFFSFCIRILNKASLQCQCLTVSLLWCDLSAWQ